MPVKSIRLNKYISQSGICSRREADELIEKGKVYINGKKAIFGDHIVPGDKVKVGKKEIKPRDEEKFIFIALNKPVGIVSTTEGSEQNNIVDYIGHPTRIFPIGRLDKDSQGLIFMTSNGDLVNKILRAGNNHEKEYIVTVDKLITDDFIKSMSSGVPILGLVTKKCKVQKESSYVFKITLIQGLNRQIRRMCEHFNYQVQKLERVRIMNIKLQGLPVGDWRDLSDDELEELFILTKDSSSESDKTGKSPVKKKNNKFSKKSLSKLIIPAPEQSPSKRNFSKKKKSRRP